MIKIRLMWMSRMVFINTGLILKSKRTYYLRLIKDASLSCLQKERHYFNAICWSRIKTIAGLYFLSQKTQNTPESEAQIISIRYESINK